MIHRSVSDLEQFAGSRSVVRIDGNADASRQSYRHAEIVLANRIAKRQRTLDCTFLIRCAQEHAEFVSAVASGNIGSGYQVPFEQRRKRAQRAIAGGVAEAIVNVFETVGIHEQHRKTEAV